MLKGYQRTQDDMIYVRNGPDNLSVYIDTLANFTTDFGTPPPALIEGANQELYEPGVRHFYADKDGVVGGGDDPWAWGDLVVANLGALLIKQQVRKQAQAAAADAAYRAALAATTGGSGGSGGAKLA